MLSLLVRFYTRFMSIALGVSFDGALGRFCFGRNEYHPHQARSFLMLTLEKRVIRCKVNFIAGNSWIAHDYIFKLRLL